MRETSGTLRYRSGAAVGLLACFLAGVVPPGAFAQENTLVLPEPPAEEEQVTPLPDVTVSAPEPRYVAPTTRDRIGRIWAPVLIDGKGPFRMVLDTGASRSAILPRVAEALKLPIAVNSVQLRGVTGSAIASSITVESLEVGDLILQGTTMPIVEDVFGGADGVLGAEGLADKRIIIEFRRDRISILYSRGQAAPFGFLTLPFTFNPNSGMRIPVVIGGVRVVGVIDTGAQATVGNLALREALARKRKEATPEEASIMGVTLDIQQADRARIPSFFAGDLLVRNAMIMFTDLHIFEHWGLSSEPAVLIGMDILGVLDTLIIDYSRSELQIRTMR